MNMDDFVDVNAVGNNQAVATLPQTIDANEFQDVPKKEPSMVRKAVGAFENVTPLGQLGRLWEQFQIVQKNPRQENEPEGDYKKRVMPLLAKNEMERSSRPVVEQLWPQMTAGLVAQAVVAPVEAGAVVAYYGAAQALGLDPDKFVEHHFPNWDPNVKDIAGIVGWIASGAPLGMGKVAIDKVRFNRALSDAGMNQNVNIHPDHLADLKKVLSPEEYQDAKNTLGIKDVHEQASNQTGHPINVPADKIADLSSKPYWNTAKDLLSKQAEPTTEDVIANQGIIRKGVAEGQKWGKAVGDTLGQAKRSLNNTFNAVYQTMSRFGGKATEAPLKMANMPDKMLLGFNNQKSEVFDKSFEELMHHFDKYDPKVLKDLMIARGTADGVPARALQESARKRLPPELQDPHVQQGITELYDYVYKQAKDNGIDLDYVQDYIRGSYKDAKKAGRLLDFWRTTDAFTKQKAFPTYADAVVFDYTMELKDFNPVDNAKSELRMIAQRVGMMKLRESLVGKETVLKNAALKYKGKIYEGDNHKSIVDENNLKSSSGLFKAEEGRDYEAGFTTNDPERPFISRDQAEAEFGVRHSGQMEKKPVKVGAKSANKENVDPSTTSYAVKIEDAKPDQLRAWDKINDPLLKDMLFDPDYARFVNNLIETNKVSQIKPLSFIRNLARYAQVAKFFGSVFHMRNMGLAAISDEAGGALNPKGWKAFAKGFKGVDKTDPKYAEYVGLVGGHGYSAEGDAQIAFNRWIDKVSKGNLDTGKKLYAKTKWVPASPEMIKWMFDEYIPGLKYNKWQIECDRLSEQRGRPLHDFEKQEVARNIQNFYGEMNERLLGRSGTVTSALRIIFSAPGYGEGNFRAIYGSMSELRAMFPGQPKTTLGGYKNVQFIATSVANVIALSAIGTWIMTGKPPAVPKNGNDVRDLMKIKTDTVDGNGDTIYYDMAGYTSDYFSVYGNLLTGRPGKIPQAMTRRFSGAQSQVYGLLVDLGKVTRGEPIYDYFGKPIYQRTDDFTDKLNKFMAYEGMGMRSISMGTFEQTSKKGVPLIPAVTSSIAGVRATTSERVKELKDARQDYFSLKDSKQQKQLEINKQYQENPEGAVKAINKFNDDQLKKLKQVQKVAGITDMDMKTMMNNFFITKVKDKKVVHGTEDAVRDLFKKAARSTNRQVVPAEKMNRIKELLGAKEGGGDDDE